MPVSPEVRRVVTAARALVAHVERIEFDSVRDRVTKETFAFRGWRLRWAGDGTGEFALVEALRAACDAAVPRRRKAAKP